MYVLSRSFKHNTLGFMNFIHYHKLHHHIIFKTLLVHCKSEYMGIRIIITKNTRGSRVIITFHLFSDNIRLET